MGVWGEVFGFLDVFLKVLGVFWGAWVLGGVVLGVFWRVWGEVFGFVRVRVFVGGFY